MGSNRAHEIRAPAKINLYLRVLGRRPDGYHEIDSMLQMVGLYDDLGFEALPAGIEMRATGERMPEGDENLIIKAAKLLRASRPGPGGVRIRVTKRIPLASGLGGASSDAAAVLLMLNRIWRLGLPTRTLAVLGARLGSDVPFFLRGPTARVGGRGTIVTPLPPLSTRWVVLVNPGVPVSTGSVYQDFEARPVEDTIPSRLGRRRPARWTTLVRGLRNDLEAVAIRRHPVIRIIKAALVAAGATGALMSGSGSTVYGLFREQADARLAARRVSDDRGWRVWVAPTLTTSPLV